jgi:hypothetical protein
VRDPVALAIARVISTCQSAEEMKARVIASFGIGYLGLAETMAYEAKGRDWLYGAALQPPSLPRTPLDTDSSSSDTRGWVYVLSNKAMPGLLKIGFSSKDPLERALELEGTGVPHPFVVEYDVLTRSARTIEQATHAILADFREGKEFFRMAVSEAVLAIRTAIASENATIIAETFRGTPGPSND